MTGSSTQVSICNRALLSIGARATIQSLTENSTESDACSVFFASTFEMLARSANWNCLRKQATLTLIAAASGTPENPSGLLAQPASPWLYSYQVPSDCLKVRFLIPNLPNPATGQTAISPAMIAAGPWVPGGQAQIPYVVGYSVDAENNPLNILLTNQTQTQAVYTVNQQNPVIWDSMFEQAMVASLSAFLVPALSMNAPLFSLAVKTAENIITQARVADGNEGVTCMDHLPDWIAARSGGSYLYGGNQYTQAQGYFDMCWPVYG